MSRDLVGARVDSLATQSLDFGLGSANDTLGSSVTAAALAGDANGLPGASDAGLGDANAFTGEPGVDIEPACFG